MLFGRKRQTFPPIKPALFLNQTLRSLEEARNLEASLPDDRSLVAAFRIYTNLIYTFQTIFSQPGPQGQDRIQPLDDEHIIYEIIEVAEDAAKGFDRLHERVSLSSAVGIRSGYYPSPSFPANISYAVSWLKSQAEAVQIQKGLEKGSTPAPENQPDTQDSAGPADISPSELPGECDVCGDTFSDATRPSRNITKGCAHPANVCKSCISETVKAHLEDRGPAIAIACPDSACNQTLSREDVKAWVTPSVFARTKGCSSGAKIQPATQGNCTPKEPHSQLSPAYVALNEPASPTASFGMRERHANNPPTALPSGGTLAIALAASNRLLNKGVVDICGAVVVIASPGGMPRFIGDGSYRS
ncbi:hypothetical protein FRC14_002759 [Serendipita sp. 396]|nr:hypothetical protein FRC14_002759 [Serendipita sp. 396]